MKRYLLLIPFLSLAFLPCTYATPNFSQPILEKANEQVNLRIEQKISRMVLDEHSKNNIEQKKERLTGILVSIDTAFQNHDTAKLREQVKLFQNGYKEIMNFTQNTAGVSTSSNTHKNIQNVATSVEATGKNTDITYYADSFEGWKTANGNPFSQSYFSAAACNIPFNTLIQISKGNGSVIVKTNDRPNCTKHPDLTDLTTVALGTIGKLSSGRMPGTINILGTVPKNYIKRTVQTAIFKDLWITLDSNIPNTYLRNETLHVTGKELSGNNYTILYLKSPSGKDITLGAKKWPDDRFEYDYPLEEVGTYQMVVASGSGFDTDVFLDITVLEDSVFSDKQLIPSTKSPGKLKKLEVERLELPNLVSLYLFHLSPSEFHILTIKWAEGTFTYKGFWTIAIRSDALKSLDITKPVFVKIDSQESSTPFSHDAHTNPITIFEKAMMLTPGYTEEKNENIVATEENGNLLIRGIVSKGKKVKNEVMLTLPDGGVEEYAFDAASIDTDGYMKRERVFEKTIPLKQTGLYRVEVNYDNGFAAYNGPVAYGDILPAYPNDYDSVQKEIADSDSSTVATESLRFVNSLRTKTGNTALSLDDTLNRLATIKANDMAQHNNLSHTDSNGDKIGGTAKRNNIKLVWGIGENIAWGNVSFKALLVGLANSGGHRANMLDAWKKIGIGYAVKVGQVYYAQVFGE